MNNQIKRTNNIWKYERQVLLLLHDSNEAVEKPPQMTIEELLKPRYKVIADWPNNTIEIGDVCTIEDDFGVFDYVFRFHVKMLECHPHLFKKLEWWEDRNLEDMPMYLKQTGMVDDNDNPIPDWYLKVKKHFNAGNGEWRDDLYSIFCIERCERSFGTSMSYSDFEPSTEEEYKQHSRVVS